MRIRLRVLRPICSSRGFTRAKPQPDMRQILERLQSLEDQNKALMSEIHALREELAAASTHTEAAPADAHLASVLRWRAADTGSGSVQSGIGAQAAGAVDGDAVVQCISPTAGIAAGRNIRRWRFDGPDPRRTAATLRQSMIGLKFDGPQHLRRRQNEWLAVPGFLGWIGGGTESTGPAAYVRRSILRGDEHDVSFGQDKPILAPRDPTSLAQVAFSPLDRGRKFVAVGATGPRGAALPFRREAGMRAQLGVYQTSESSNTIPTDYKFTLIAAGVAGTVRVLAAVWRRAKDRSGPGISREREPRRRHLGPIARCFGGLAGAAGGAGSTSPGSFSTERIPSVLGGQRQRNRVSTVPADSRRCTARAVGGN